MDTSVQQIFVYGSLRSGFRHPAYEYISRYFTLVGEAKVKGRLYDMGSYPAATPATDEVYIIGELYRLKHANEFSWAFEQLDDYEGVGEHDPQYPSYKREITTVYANNTASKAWIYWFNGIIEDQPLIASGDILEFLQHKSKL